MPTLNHKPQAVLFDLDGTLIDSAPDLGAAADKMRTDRGLPSLPLECYRPLAGMGGRGMLRIALCMESSHSDFLTMREEFFRNYEAAMTERTCAFDGVPELLAQLGQGGVRWGVVTNKSARFTDPLVATMPLFKHCAVAISGDTTAHAKPHPEPVLEAARRIHVAPERCWYVGDDKRDIDAGRAAGMFTVAATWGYLGDHPWQTWEADAVAHSPAQLMAMLSQP